MAARAEVPGLASEGEEAIVSAIRALETLESSSEVAASVEVEDDVMASERGDAVDGAMPSFVARERPRSTLFA